MEGGVRVVQLRDKRGLDRGVLRAVAARARAYGALTIANDDVGCAALCDGVHLGQDDVVGNDLGILRERLAGKIFGLSCGTPEEARRAAAAGVDYAGVGPMFATRTKGDAGLPIGASGVRAVVRATPMPVVAIGGITRERMPRVRATGALMAAVASALADAPDARATALALAAAWG